MVRGRKNCLYFGKTLFPPDECDCKNCMDVWQCFGTRWKDLGMEVRWDVRRQEEEKEREL